MPFAGRGGAGNISAAAEADKLKRGSKDLEGNAIQYTTTDRVLDVGDAASQLSAQSYTHMGRGGAGNYYSPSELLASGDTVLTSSTDATAPPTQMHCPTSSAPIYTGRGGAGNYTRGDTTVGVLMGEGMQQQYGSLGARELKEGMEMEEMVKKKVEKDVGEALPKPQQAWLGGKETVAGEEVTFERDVMDLR